VDASEAWKHPDKKDYFFGAHDDNRLQFTVGRDIRLDHLSRAIRSTTSSILTRSWTENRSRWNPSSRSKTESTVATEALSVAACHAWEVGFISRVRRSPDRATAIRKSGRTPHFHSNHHATPGWLASPKLTAAHRASGAACESRKGFVTRS